MTASGGGVQDGVRAQSVSERRLIRDGYTITIRPRRLARAAGLLLAIAVVAALGAYAARQPLLTWLGRQLVREDPLAPSDAIVVLAGGTPSREIEAADLYRAEYAREIILTVEPEPVALEILRGRGIGVRSRLEERVQYFSDLGVPRSALTVLDAGTVVSTAQEAALVAEWVRRTRLTSLIVVTSRFHSARSSMVFERTFRGTGVTLRVRPTTADDFRPEDWWRHRPTLRDGIFEWQKLLLYRIRY